MIEWNVINGSIYNEVWTRFDEYIMKSVVLGIVFRRLIHFPFKSRPDLCIQETEVVQVSRVGVVILWEVDSIISQETVLSQTLDQFPRLNSMSLIWTDYDIFHITNLYDFFWLFPLWILLWVREGLEFMFKRIKLFEIECLNVIVIDISEEIITSHPTHLIW